MDIKVNKEAWTGITAEDGDKIQKILKDVDAQDCW